MTPCTPLILVVVQISFRCGFLVIMWTGVKVINSTEVGATLLSSSAATTSLGLQNAAVCVLLLIIRQLL